MEQIITNPQAYCYDRLFDAQRILNKRLPPVTIPYLIKLIENNAFVMPESLFEAFVLAEEATTVFERHAAYKRLGDAGLVISSLFPEWAVGRGVGLEYCHSMAIIGYNCAFGITKKEVYSLLSQNIYSISLVTKKAFAQSSLTDEA